MSKPEHTLKMSLDSSEIEVTQKIEIDYEEVIDESKKAALISEIKQDQELVNNSVTRSVFTRRRITDDYVKSSTIVSRIAKVPPLQDKLELQDVHNNYELQDQFSEGAQGIIRNAFDKSLKRNIVIKSLKVDKNEDYARQDESLFVSEARIMAQLDHPSIIPLYGLHSGTENKLHLAMKHIHGKTLKQYLADVVDLYEREGIDKFDEEHSIVTRIEYLIKVCEAIDYAHCKGVVHRDLKPENIMIGNYGEVYVMDWGLACLIETDGEEAHNKNEIVGTPCYIAPEIIRGGMYKPKSDIFALGMILFEIVNLQRCVSGKTVNEVLKNIINWNYNPFKHHFLKKKPSDDIKAIVAKAIHDPESHRYKSASDMAKDLRFYLMREETAARPDNIFRKYMRAMVNHKMITFAVVLLVLLVLSLSVIHNLYTQNTMIVEQKAHEDMLAYFQNYASQRANKMERIFFYLKNQLRNSAYRAEKVLGSKVYTSKKTYRHRDFLNKNTAPNDYIYAPAYDMKISLEHTVLKLGPGTKADGKLNERVVGLEDMFKHVMFTSNPDFEHKSKSYIKDIIINKGAPLIWIYMGLENGSMLSCPGKIYVKNYDPRKRPWYKSALNKNKYLVWSKPYLDTSKRNIVISCMRCIYDRKNNFLGVIAIDISLNYIQKYMFNEKVNSVVKEYLLNKKNQVILSSDFEDKNAKISKRTTLVMNKFYFYKELQKAIKDEKVNFEATKDGIKYIFAINKIPSLEYYHIQKVSAKNLRRYWEKTISRKKK